MSFETKLEKFTEVSQRLAVWKKVHEFISTFLPQDTSGEPAHMLRVTIPTVGQQLADMKVVLRVEAEVLEKIEDLSEQVDAIKGE